MLCTLWSTFQTEDLSYCTLGTIFTKYVKRISLDLLGFTKCIPAIMFRHVCFSLTLINRNLNPTLFCVLFGSLFKWKIQASCTETYQTPGPGLPPVWWRSVNGGCGTCGLLHTWDAGSSGWWHWCVLCTTEREIKTQQICVRIIWYSAVQDIFLFKPEESMVSFVQWCKV